MANGVYNSYLKCTFPGTYIHLAFFAKLKYLSIHVICLLYNKGVFRKFQICLFFRQDVSFGVAPGEVVALVGPSGGGKSSCVNLLEHFYEAEHGQVLLDGIPIDQYDHRYLHTKVSMTPRYT